MVVGGSALGMTLGPLLQLIASTIGHPGVPLFGGLSLSTYTLPAVLACIMDVVAVLVIKVQKQDFV